MTPNTQYQDSRAEIKVQVTFHQKFKPVTSEHHILRAILDQMDTNSPIIRHLVAMPDQPTAPYLIHLCLRDKNQKHWKARLWNQYDKKYQHVTIDRTCYKGIPSKKYKVYPTMIAI